MQLQTVAQFSGIETVILVHGLEPTPPSVVISAVFMASLENPSDVLRRPPLAAKFPFKFNRLKIPSSRC